MFRSLFFGGVDVALLILPRAIATPRSSAAVMVTEGGVMSDSTEKTDDATFPLPARSVARLYFQAEERNDGALDLYFPGGGTKWPCLTFYFQEAKNEMAPLAVPLHWLGDPTKHHPCGGGRAGSTCGLRAELYLISGLVWFGGIITVLSRARNQK